ncbi:MAG TPA: formate dehydrogenase accessory protein FdhE [Anaeromyxobacteraceae bacterium]|nr:formate dehydrogenase accessory protein FdhE [Anaeromyxobacteraceae bacterium]
MTTSLPVVDGGPIVPVRLPEPERLFAARAERLEALARGHAAGPFLELLARVARGQHAAARELRAVQNESVRPEELRAVQKRSVRPEPVEGRTDERAPLDQQRPDPAWRAALPIILGAVKRGSLPPPAAEAIRRLEPMEPAELERLGAAVLALEPADPAAAPFVLAAMEVAFARRAAALDPGAVPPARTRCPVCGGPPVASVVGGNDRLRYVSCGRCASRWHVTRVQCATCRETGGISYFEVEGALAGARAEACDGCRTYLKVFDAVERPGADAVADDAATIVLDLLVAERGYRRAGENPLAPGGERA